MAAGFSRRSFLRWTALAPSLGRAFAAPTAPQARSPVSLVRGDDRRKNVAQALTAIDAEIRPVLNTRKYVAIKVNNVSTANPLASTHADAVHGILDYLEPRFRGPVYIVESSAGDTLEGYETFHYGRIVSERRAQNVRLVDLNREAGYRVVPMLSYDLHPKPARLAARLFDPDAYIFSSAMLKTHNCVVATLSVKNMALGAPLHSAPGDSPWNDKRVVHNGLRQLHYNIFLAAQSLRPFWGAAVLDGFEGMEGNGPGAGTPVASRIAIASADFVAADRVGIEAMGINPEWMGYLLYCSEFGLGQYDLGHIELRGETLATVRRKYQLHPDIERELDWMGPLEGRPPRLG